MGKPDKKCKCGEGQEECFFGNDDDLVDNYFSPQAKRAFSLDKKCEKVHIELIKILEELFFISLVELIVEKKKSNQPQQTISKRLEQHLVNGGFIKKKSIKYNIDTNIGSLFKFIISSKDVESKITTNDKNTCEINKEYSCHILRKYCPKKKELDLYKPFSEILKREFCYDLEALKNKNSSKFQVIIPTTQKGKGRWSNPDVVVSVCADNIAEYSTYEIKRWLDMSPIAPHEARNHARIISNYPYVAIHAPKALFEFIIEYNYDFQIIKEDCRERGIGLILFDTQGKHFFKILNANHFKPDTFRKKDYINNLSNRSKTYLEDCAEKKSQVTRVDE